jgi:hypothetical protein
MDALLSRLNAIARRKSILTKGSFAGLMIIVRLTLVDVTSQIACGARAAKSLELA